MQWWCYARNAAWTWSWQAYPGVWIFVALLALGYGLLRRQLGDDVAAPGRSLRPLSFAAGLAFLWAALDWPLGALGAGYLASAHMVQFLFIALIAPPLLLIGMPRRAFDALDDRPFLLRPLRMLTHPLMALGFFNVALVATHWPSVVDRLMVTQVGSFALDMAWLAAGLVLWWPIVAPVPQRPRFTYMYRIGYLILGTILNTPAFALLTFSDLPLYATFELAPPVEWIASRDDQRLAGLIMKIGGGLVYWTAITVLFVRWYLSEQVEESE